MPGRSTDERPNRCQRSLDSDSRGSDNFRAHPAERESGQPGDSLAVTGRLQFKPVADANETARRTGSARVCGQAIEVIEPRASGPGWEMLFAEFGEPAGELGPDLSRRGIASRDDAALAGIGSLEQHLADAERLRGGFGSVEAVLPEGFTPSTSRFARRRPRTSSSVRPGNHSATVSSVATLTIVGPVASVSSGKPPSGSSISKMSSEK